MKMDFVRFEQASSQGQYGRAWGRQVDASPTASASAIWLPGVSVNRSRLRGAFDRALKDAEPLLDEAEREVARNATSQAIALLGDVQFDRMPWADITDEGVALVQWQRDDRGIVFAFTGDGEYTVARKYMASENYLGRTSDLNVSASLSLDLITEIGQISTDDEIATT